MVLRLELLGLGDVHPAPITLAVALGLESQLLALRVHHSAVVVVHVWGEHQLGLGAVLKVVQLDIDGDARALGDGALAGGEAAEAPPPAAPPAPAAPPTTSASATRHCLVSYVIYGRWVTQALGRMGVCASRLRGPLE